VDREVISLLASHITFTPIQSSHVRLDNIEGFFLKPIVSYKHCKSANGAWKQQQTSKSGKAYLSEGRVEELREPSHGLKRCHKA
jgi:hypothetical protein